MTLVHDTLPGTPMFAGARDRIQTCTQKYRISELKNKKCKVLNATAIASGYVGRDPQVRTSDGSFL